MEYILNEIGSKVVIASNNLTYAQIVYEEAIYDSGLEDNTFKSATRHIIKEMEKLKITFQDIVDRLNVLHNTNSDPKFLQKLNKADEMAVGVVSKSDFVMEQMRIAVSNAEKRKKARTKK
ncbi:unnamed protein product [Cochlearia groenlandica]